MFAQQSAVRRSYNRKMQGLSSTSSKDNLKGHGNDGSEPIQPAMGNSMSTTTDTTGFLPKLLSKVSKTEESS